MPDWFAVVLLGIVEGVTEFLPVSSTGHLLLLQNTGIVPHQSELFNVGIQCGAVLAVLAVFWRRCVTLVSGFREPEHRDYLVKLLAAFLLTGVGGAALKAAGLELPETATPVAVATLVGGVLILVAERRLRGRPASAQLTWSIVLVVALAQLLAASCPGTSRSGACMVAAMLLGLGRPAATEFSFLVGVPTLLSAGFLEVALSVARGQAGDENWGLLALGAAVSAVVAFAVVRWLLRFVVSHTLDVFGWYRIALGVLILGLVSSGDLFPKAGGAMIGGHEVPADSTSFLAPGPAGGCRGVDAGLSRWSALAAQRGTHTGGSCARQAGRRGARAFPARLSVANLRSVLVLRAPSGRVPEGEPRHGARRVARRP